MLVWQVPINPKDWQIVGPVIIAIVLLVLIGVWALTQLKKAGIIGGNGSATAPDVIKDISEIKARLNEHQRRIGRHQDEFIRDLGIMSSRISNLHDRISKLEK